MKKINILEKYNYLIIDINDILYFIKIIINNLY